MKQINTYINEKLRLTTKPQYTCQPADVYELRNIVIDRIKDEGTDCDFNDIDTSKITNMSQLFDAVNNKIFENFNCDISLWDVSNVKDMGCMFNGCEKFNCDLSKWNVSKVKCTAYMFCRCKKFDCDLSNWNVSNVKDMGNMFSGCEKFNQNLDSWDVSNVKYMYNAFEGCPTTPTWYDKDKWEP